MIVFDTGLPVALSNERDEHCVAAANDFFRDLLMAGEEVDFPATVIRTYPVGLD